MAEPFRVWIAVRGYELDAQGHLANAVYHQYGDHARSECLRAAGITTANLLANRVGLVTLETTIRFRRELRGGDEVTVTCAFVWRDGKTFRIEQEFRRRDGTLAAESSSLSGLLDLTERRLVSDPAEHFRRIASDPHVLGL